MWNITGTEQQQAIVRDALTKIKFPFERLTLPGTPELGWDDLNTGYYRAIAQHTPLGGHEDGDSPEPLKGRIDEQRNYILGVFYPGSARIYIDNLLVKYPEIAKATISAEIAHAVDEFLPLKESQRDALMIALHGGIEHADTHSWWEKVDYGAEYYSLVGETFMILFTKAYSDIPFGNAEDFVHTGANVSAETVRSIIGIERTDTAWYVRYGKSLVYHRPTHKVRHSLFSEIRISDVTVLRPCKVCKP